MSIQPVDKTESVGYTTCLLDCVLEVWKRVHAYARAFFDYFFGEPGPVVLPPGVTMIIADCLLMPNQYEDFLSVTRRLTENGQQFIYKFDLKIDLLRKAFISIMGLADCFDAPHLLKKIEQIFLRYYYIPPDDAGQHWVEEAHDDISWVFSRIDDPVFLNKRKAEFAKSLEVTLEEFPQAIRDWRAIKKIQAIADLFASVARGEKFPSIYVPIRRAQADAICEPRP